MKYKENCLILLFVVKPVILERCKNVGFQLKVYHGLIGYGYYCILISTYYILNMYLYDTFQFLCFISNNYLFFPIILFIVFDIWLLFLFDK